MSHLFKAPQAQPIVLPAAPPPVPTVDTAAASRDQTDNIRKRRGRLASILTGNSGATLTSSDVSAPSLLGG